MLATARKRETEKHLSDAKEVEFLVQEFYDAAIASCGIHFQILHTVFQPLVSCRQIKEFARWTYQSRQPYISFVQSNFLLPQERSMILTSQNINGHC